MTSTRDSVDRVGVRFVTTCAMLAAFGCGDSEDPERLAVPYHLGVTVPGDETAEAFLVTVLSDTAAVPGSDSTLEGFGVDVVATRTVVGRPVTRRASKLVRDTVLSHHAETDIREVELEFDRAGGADMVGIQFPEGQGRVVSVKRISMGVSHAAGVDFWHRAGHSASLTATVEVPMCDTVPLVLVEHFLEPREWGGEWRKDSIPQSVNPDSRFRVMVRGEVLLKKLPPCCPRRRPSPGSTSAPIPTNARSAGGRP